MLAQLLAIKLVMMSVGLTAEVVTDLWRNSNLLGKAAAVTTHFALAQVTLSTETNINMGLS